MTRQRPLIAFFDYPDVFEDFYPHYGVDQRAFATRWASTGNHAVLSLLQREVGDVVWFAFSLAPELAEATHAAVGCRIKFLRSSWVHRRLWRAFYLSRHSWRWQGAYPYYAAAASYAALASREFVRALWQERPDFVFVQDYATGRFDTLLALSRMLRAPLVARHSGSLPENYKGRWVKRWTIPRADRLIVSSREEYDRLAVGYGVAPERLALILTPIDTNAFRPLERAWACAEVGLDPDRRHLLFVGRLDDGVKRVGALVRQFAALATRFPDADLVIAGDGPDGPRLRALAADLAPGRVRFPGWVSGAQALAPWYNAAECLVLPSLREGFPAVVGEAMACGAPVVGSRVGGVAELVVPGRTGWLIRPGDDDALRNVLETVLSDPVACRALRPNARHAAEERVSHAAVATALKGCFARNGGGDG
jgi:glycosyltransferase involved in cell wall biosynthesis